MANTPTLTTLGTPCARSWTNDWVAAVNATEHELNRRICGARLPDATPCCNTSDHPSGRCPFHGGFDLTGAPPGNRNHVIHGLYTRRLRPCTQACPHWETCPVANTLTHHVNRHPRAGGDPSSQSESLQTPDSGLQPSSPPPCPYQLTEYNTVLTDALAIVESQPHSNPMGIHTAHNVATLQVLVSNAAAQLAQAPNLWSSEDPNPHTPNPNPQPPNPNAILAFTRLMREFRASLKLLHAPGYTPLNRQNAAIQGSQSALPMSPSPEGILRHAERIQHDTGLDPDSQAAAQLPPQTPETHAKAYIQRAALAGGQGRDIEMCEAFDEAGRIDEVFAESERDHVLASYRPAKQTVSEELAEAILGNLHLPPLPKNEDGDPIANHAPNEHEISPESFDVLQYYLDLVRDGKVPPEAYPIGSPARAQAEAIYTGPPLTPPNSPDQGGPATRKLTSEVGPATPKLTCEGGPATA